jgi:hypothetical protein
MRRKEVPRAGLLEAAREGRIGNVQGARSMRVCLRQFQRMKARFAPEGVAGLVHRLRGRPSPDRLAAAIHARVGGAAARRHLCRVNDSHLTEKRLAGAQVQRQTGAVASSMAPCNVNCGPRSPNRGNRLASSSCTRAPI